MASTFLCLFLLAAQAGYDTALENYRAGRLAESQALLEDLIEQGSGEAKVFGLLAWCHHRQGRPNKALAAIRRAIELAPDEVTWYNQAAQILLENRAFEAAYRTAVKALDVDPDSAQAWKLKGRLELERGAKKQALKSFLRSTELNPEDPEALMWLGIARAAMWEYEEAAAVFERGIARFPMFAPMYAAYGGLLLEPRAHPDAKTKKRAQALIEKALALDPALPYAHYDLGKLLLQEGEVGEAVQHLEAAVRLDPRNSQYRLMLANAYRSAGRRKDQARELDVYRKLKAQEAGRK